MFLELLMAGAIAGAPKTPPAQALPPQAEAARVYRNAAPTIDRCRGGSVLQAVDKPAPPEATRLGDLPKANAERAVLVMQNGCVKPQIAAYGVGR